MKHKTTEHVDAFVPLVAAELEKDKVPERILLAPWGHVETKNGYFVVDADSACAVIEAFEAHGTDLPIDYEHQTLGGQYSSPNGQAPAAGWIQQIVAEPGEGLFAEVAWTQAALDQLGEGEYRYLSPVAMVRKSDRRIMAIHSAALTNKPAIAHMQPLVNRDEVSLEAVEALVSLLKLKDHQSTDELIVAALRRIEELETQHFRKVAEEQVELAAKQGKLTPAQKEWAISLALKDADLFEQWVQSAPTVVSVGCTEPPSQADEGKMNAQLEASARAEYRAHPELQAITSEEAWVKEGKRQACNA